MKNLEKVFQRLKTNTYLNKKSTKEGAAILKISEQLFLNLKAFKEYSDIGTRILVIGDLHCPNELKKYLKFNCELRDKYCITDVVFIGDIVDNYWLSTFVKSPDYERSPTSELKEARQSLQTWYTEFPEATVINGNHDFARLKKIAGLSSIPSIYLKSFSEIYNLPEWKFIDEAVIDGIHFEHGERGTALKIANKLQKSVVCGHRHTETYINYINNDTFAIQTPCGLNRSELPFDYVKKSLGEFTTGSIVIINKEPIIKIMK